MVNNNRFALVKSVPTIQKPILERINVSAKKNHTLDFLVRNFLVFHGKI
jgi:hypothetical protein